MEETTLVTLLVGAALGAGFTVAVQAMGWVFAYTRSRRFAGIALGLLARHVLASQKSLVAIQSDQPVYLQVARVRFCKVDSALMPGDLERIGILSRTNERARLLMMAVRNRVLFLDEVATRMDGMNNVARMQAIADAAENMRILDRFLRALGYGGAGSREDAAGEIASRILKPSTYADVTAGGPPASGELR